MMQRGRKMRHAVFAVISIPIFVSLLFSTQLKDESLAEFYKTGSVRFVPELTIDDSTMPEDVLFESISDIAIGPDGCVYVCDYQASNIKKFNSSGEYLKTIGQEGQGPGDLRRPMCITISRERIFLWELGNRRLSCISLDGVFINSVGLSVFEGWPRRLRSLPSGDFVIDRLNIAYGDEQKDNCSIEVFSPELEHKETVFKQDYVSSSQTTDPRRRVGIPFSPRVHWDVSPSSRIIIGFSKAYKIIMLTTEGKQIGSFEHEYAPITITEKEKNDYFSNLIMATATSGGVTQRKKGADDFIRKHTRFPKFKPPFSNVKSDSEGNILIYPYQDVSPNNPRYFDAFDSNGRYLNRVKILGRIRTFGNPTVFFQKRSVWAIERDEDDLYIVVKYRIEKS